MSDKIDIETERAGRLSIQKNKHIYELIATNANIPHKVVNIPDLKKNPKYLCPSIEETSIPEVTQEDLDNI